MSAKEESVKTTESAYSTVIEYIIGYKNLEFMADKYGLSKTTLYRKIGAESKKAPSWFQVTRSVKEDNKWGFVMGIDTTRPKINGKEYVYLHVVDIPSKDPLAYQICKKEDAATVKRVLLHLRDIGYTPKIVVLDLAGELLAAVKDVYPEAIIQGCVVHVRFNLDKKLPTRKSGKKFSVGQIELYRKVKKLINCICVAKDENTRQELLQELDSLNLDKEARRVVALFLGNLEYYHTLDEEEFKQYGERILNNNLCERHIQFIKSLKRKMRGFKSLDSTINLINILWLNLRRDSGPLAEKESTAYWVPEMGSVSMYSMPLWFYSKDPANLALLSKSTSTPIEVLAKKAKEMDRILIGDHAFTKNKLDHSYNKILTIIRKAVKQIMQKTDCDYPATVALMQKSGIRVNKKAHDPTRHNDVPDDEKELHSISNIERINEVDEVNDSELEKRDEVERGLMLTDPAGFWAVFKDETNKTACELMNCSGLNGDDPFMTQSVIPLEALLKYESENGEHDIKIGESYYDANTLASVLKLTGNHDVKFYQTGKDKPLGIRTDTHMGAVAPRVIGICDTEAEREEAEEIDAKMSTLEEIIYFSRKSNIPEFSLSDYAKAMR